MTSLYEATHAHLRLQLRRPGVSVREPTEKVRGVSVPSARVTRHGVVASFGLPHPPYLRTVIRRSAGIWVLVRCMYVMVLMFGGAFANLLPLDEGVSSALHPDGVTRAVLVAATMFLVWWDRRRSRELLFYANLGTHPGWFWAASLLTASVLDIVVQTLLEVR